MIKTIPILLLFCSVSSGQFGAGKTTDGMEYMSVRLGFPCDQSLDGLPCFPDREGVMVQVNAPSGARYRVTVTFLNLDGEEEARSLVFAWRSEWITKAFRIGRVKTPTLAGVTVTEVRIEREGAETVTLKE